MLTMRFAVWFSVGLMVLVAGGVSGQDYPNRPIHINSVAGASLLGARLVADGISSALGQPVIVDIRPSGPIAVDTTFRAPPDGHTLIVSGGGLWITPLTRTSPYDPVKDFAPISMVGTTPNVLVITPSLPVKSIKELIVLAKARPGELNFPIGGVGGATHLAGELFKSMAGVNILMVPYASNAQASTDLMTGRVQLTITSPASVMGHVKAGKLRALAVTSLQPTVLVPGVPTVAASGLPGYEVIQPIAMFAPAKTPATIINRLNQEVVRVLNRADVKEKLLNDGVEASGGSPEQLAAAMKAEIALWGKVIKDAGIKVE